MTQYEIWWAELPPPVGRRPVLLLSRPDAFNYLNKVIVVEVTRTVRGIRQEVRLGRREGLAEPSVANFDSLHTVLREQLKTRIGAVGSSREAELKHALGFALAWQELTPDR